MAMVQTTLHILLCVCVLGGPCVRACVRDSSFYFERRPLGFLGPINPGMEYFRASLTGWTSDENSGGRFSCLSPPLSHIRSPLSC